MVLSRTWPSVLCFLLLFVISITTLGQVYSSEAEVKDDTTKTKCRQHIEEALSKYWDQETGTLIVPDGAQSDISIENSIESDQKPETAEPSEETISDKQQPCDDDDKDGICNEDEEDIIPEPVVPAVEEVEEVKPSCPDDDKDGICNDDEVEEIQEEPVEEKTEDEEEDEEEERRVSQRKRKEKRRSQDDEDEDEDSSSRRRRRRKQREEEDDDEEEEEEDRRRRRKGKSRRSTDDDDEYERRSSKKRRRGRDEEEEEEIEQDDDKATGNDDKQEEEVVQKDDKKVINSEASEIEETKQESEEDSEQATEVTSGHSHVDEILRLGEIGSKEDTAEQNLILSIFKDLKKIYQNSIKPLEQMYKYREISTRLISDAEIFAKPMVLFLGPNGSGKTSLVNYLLGLQSTPWQLNTGISTSYPHFTLLLQGDAFTKLSPTELSADFTFSGLQQFGQHFVEHHIQAFKMPLDILQKMTLVDCPGFMDGSMMPKEPGKGIDGEVYQWFIDRSDVIFIVIDVNQLHLTANLQSLLEQLRGRDVRFIISKSDAVTHSQIVTLIGQLLWALSPLMTNNQPPQVYALTTQMETYDPFLDLQEQEWLQDLSNQVSGLARVESHIAEVRRHALRVRNHAKIIDCYLGTYYRNKGLFMFGSSAKKFASEITENPSQYRVFSGALASQAQNISRYDLPDPELYRDFFRSNNLLDFKQLSATCSFFKGCPLDKLDVAIAYQLPDLVTKYKKLTKTKV